MGMSDDFEVAIEEGRDDRAGRAGAVRGARGRTPTITATATSTDRLTRPWLVDSVS